MSATTINSYGVELNQGPPGAPQTYAPLRPNQLGGRLRFQMFTYKAASDASGQNIALLKLPKGARLLDVAVSVSASLSSATLTFGLAGANGNGNIDDGPNTSTPTNTSESIGAVVADSVNCIATATTYTSANTLVKLLGANAQNYQAAPAAEGVLSIAGGAWLYMLAKDCYLTMTVGTASLGTQVIQGYATYVVD